jgi:hypothetical protein
MTALSLVSQAGGSLQLVSLALMAGGMLALGAFTAPALFQFFNRVDAGLAMTTMFRRFDVLVGICLALLVAGKALHVLPLLLSGQKPWQSGLLSFWLPTALWLLIVGLTAYSLFAVNPQVEQLQKAGIATLEANDPQVQRFDKLHKLSEQLYKLDFTLAILLLALTPWWLWPKG